MKIIKRLLENMYFDRVKYAIIDENYISTTEYNYGSKIANSIKEALNYFLERDKMTIEESKKIKEIIRKELS